MGIRDRQIDWLRQSRIITLAEFFGGGSQDNTNKLEQFAAGNPVLTEVSSFGFGGGNIAAAGDTFAALDLQTPRLVDPAHPIGVRVHYMTLGTVATTDDITWIVLYDQVDIGEAIIAPATALNTTIAEHRQGVATTLVCHRTARGIINANTLDFTARQGLLTWSVEADAMDYDANEIAFLGLEIDYIPLLCINPEEDLGALNADLTGA